VHSINILAGAAGLKGIKVGYEVGVIVDSVIISKENGLTEGKR